MSGPFDLPSELCEYKSPLNKQTSVRTNNQQSQHVLHFSQIGGELPMCVLARADAKINARL